MPKVGMPVSKNAESIVKDKNEHPNFRAIAINKHHPHISKETLHGIIHDKDEQWKQHTWYSPSDDKQESKHSKELDVLYNKNLKFIARMKKSSCYLNKFNTEIKKGNFLNYWVWKKFLRIW